jgi:heme A synthase
MVGGVRFEHSHRMLAAVVALLTLGLVVWARRTGPPLAGRVATIALGLVVLQALLGAATVLLRLPAAISVAHLATAMSFLLMTIWLAWLTNRGSAPSGRDAETRRHVVLLALACTAVQILLGAVVKHSASSLSCPLLILCDGSARPLDARQWLQLLHRGGALVTASAVGFLVLRGLRGRPRGDQALVLLSLTLVGIQITLGILSVATALAVWAVTLHLAAGTLLLSSLWLDWLLLGARPGAR